MAEIGEISVKISADNSSLTSSIANAKSSLTEMQTTMSNVGNTLTGMGKTLSLGVSLPILGIGAAATQLAMDAVESENLFNVAMGSMATSARTWSEELSKSLGLNAVGVRENVATLNAMMTSMGMNATESLKFSEGLTQLSYDMASFYNLKPEEAFAKLQAGISGESEPLKQLGILVNDTTIKAYALSHGIIQQGETMTEAQKVQARYGAIMAATSAAQGDLARTMDSPTNQLRIMSEQVTQLGITFGQLLIPIMQSVMNTIQPLIVWLQGLTKEKQMLVVGIGLVVAAIGPLLVILGSMATGLSVLAGALTFLTGPIGLTIAAIGLLVGAFVWLWNTNDDFKNAMLKAWNELKPKLLAVWDAMTSAFKEGWALVQKFWDTYGTTITSAIQTIWENISKIIGGVLTIIQGAFTIWSGIFSGDWSKVWTGIKTELDGIWTVIKTIFTASFDIIIKAVTALLLAIWDNGLKPLYVWLKDTFSNIFTTVANALTGAWNGLTNIVTGIWTGISGAIKGGINEIIGFINTFIKKVNSIKIKIPSVDIPGIGTVGGNSVGFSVPEIPKLAKGGIVTSSTIANIGEAGPEMIVPLENTSFVTKIADAIGSAVSSAMGSGSGNGREIVLNIDGNRIARVLNPYLDSQRVRVSDLA